VYPSYKSNLIDFCSQYSQWLLLKSDNPYQKDINMEEIEIDQQALQAYNMHDFQWNKGKIKVQIPNEATG